MVYFNTHDDFERYALKPEHPFDAMVEDLYYDVDYSPDDDSGDPIKANVALPHPNPANVIVASDIQTANL